jgi:hypothetical protein
MFEKLKFLVAEICKEKNVPTALKIIENSECEFKQIGSAQIFHPANFEVIFHLNPSIFVKIIDRTTDLSDILLLYFQKVSENSERRIDRVIIKPDYNRINVLNSNISIVETPWEEINKLQKEIIEKIKSADTILDYQNIGNSSRTIMDKIARIVFNPDKHKAPKNVEVNNGKFKNQLHTYIKTNLAGEQNKEFRSFSTDAISFTESSIDLMNQTTHKLDVQKHFAEVCVISTISVISLIKAINEL